MKFLSVRGPGQTLIYQWALYDETCAVTGLPTIAVDAPPRFGLVTIEPGPVEVRSGDVAACDGVRPRGLRVFYEPAPSFRGEDGMELRLERPGFEPSRFKVWMDVR